MRPFARVSEIKTIPSFRILLPFHIRRKLLTLALIAFAASSSVPQDLQAARQTVKKNSEAADCEKCNTLVKKVASLEESKAKSTKLLGDNLAYLAMLSSKEASKFLKIESNKKLILQRIDTIKGDLEKTRQALEKEGCTQCPTQTQNNP